MNHKEQENQKGVKALAAEECPEIQTKGDEPKTDAMQQKLEQCQVQVEEWKERCMRVSADFANFQKRVNKERTDWIQSAQANVLRDVLSIVDDFERALREVKKHEQTAELQSWLAGFEMIYQSLQKFLAQHNVKQMEDYTTFNPEYHEALATVESNEHESGAIVEVLQHGYLFNDTVLRPAKVSVAK